MKKNCVISLLIFTIICNISVLAISGFSDLSKTHWAYNAVIKMVDKGVINGYPNGTFNPQGTLTRAEFSKIMVKALNLEKINEKDFLDVTEEHWGKEYIQKVSNYLPGYQTENGEMFYPDNSAVREDIAIALVKAQGLENSKYDLSILDRFTDRDEITYTNQKYLAIAIKNGIINGYEDNTIKPQGTLTRAEAVQLMFNVLSEEKKKLNYDNIYLNSVFDVEYVIVRKNYQYGLIDSMGREVISCKYSGIGESFSEGLIIVTKLDKCGYANMRGEEVIYCKYEAAKDFSEGLAAVKLNGKWGYIDTKGKQVIPCIYDDVYYSFSDGLTAVKLNNKWGYIDTKGKQVVPHMYEFASDFSEGLADVRLNGKWGYINTKGEVVIPYTYEYTIGFSEGLAGVRMNGKMGYINTKGEVVIPYTYNTVLGFSDGLAIVEMNGKLGYIDNKGNVILPGYDYAYDFREGMGKVKVNGKYGCVNNKGEEIIPCIYDGIYYFDNNRAIVEENGQYYLIKIK